MNKPTWIIGVDEVGRGPVAGPITVGAVATRHDFVPIESILMNPEKPKSAFIITDSKKMTEKRREKAFEYFGELRGQGGIVVGCASVNADIIDDKGIVYAIQAAVIGALKQLDLDPSDCRVLLDGGLKAPDEYINQESFIKGDSKFWHISAASIIAKVTRDRKMVAFAETYPEYGFEGHKGYGTKAHMDAIREHGICPLHRVSWLKNI